MAKTRTTRAKKEPQKKVPAVKKPAAKNKPTAKKAPVKKTARELEADRTHKRCMGVCKAIEDDVLSLRKALEATKLDKDYTTKLSSSTFFKWLEIDEKNSKRFARACEDRQESIFEECLDIADDDADDEKAFVGMNHIQRDKLKIYTRLQMLARMNPVKYGEKVDVNNTGDITVTWK